ncbi:MAG: L-alanine-DL-glutamate epimerase-like enolase superfamily enzyme [Flavobacteriaceae bacterium]|mgnify:FL=1|jgi:L-alanine-DL-glutamate epimerase-like enolase superfamily enzyme|tara:strand:- start:2 stop:1012 length:1011 start_codon:yes stop_codon:yes gene_type:complete
MELTLSPYRLELAHTFSISRESHDFQDSLVVSLSHKGKTGYGEATSNAYYHITSASMAKEIGAHKVAVESHLFLNPTVFYSFIKKLGLSNFSLCALDLAAWDLYGKILQKPLYQIWKTKLDHYPTTNYTIGIDSIDKMLAKMEEKPWPIYKIKLGTKEDVAIIKALREKTSAVFRVDANCAWGVQETIDNGVALKKLGVEFIEQPMAAAEWEGMKRVYEKSVLPLMADESCLVPEDVSKCVGHFHGINIKLTKCGGLSPALKMIQEAKSLGLKTMVGCMTESSVGISAIAQLLPQLDFVDMDGALLLKNDIAKGVVINSQAAVIFPSLGGSGIELL